MAVVEQLTAQLAPQGVPVIEVYNKADLISPEDIPLGENKIAVSAASGANLDGLLARMEQNLNTGVERVILCCPTVRPGSWTVSTGRRRYFPQSMKTTVSGWMRP